MGRQTLEAEQAASTLAAALYCRVSSAGQIDGASLDEQELSGRTTCERLGWEVAGVYVEEGKPASKPTIDNRPELLKLLADADAGAFRAVVVLNDTRYARHMIADAAITGRLLAAGVRYVATEAGGVDDLSTAEGLLMRSVKAFSAQKDSEHRVQAVKGGKAGLGRRGKFANARVPYGYRWQRGPRGETGVGRPVEEPQEARVVQLVFRLAAEKQMRPMAIVHHLAEAGIATRSGKPWAISVIKRVIRRRIYLGEWSTKEGAAVVWAGTAPRPLVTEETWQRAQAAMDVKRPRQRRHKRDFLLQGSLTCGGCGRPLTVTQPFVGDHRYRYYRCSRRCGPYVPATALEQRVWGHVAERIRDPRLAREAAEATRDTRLDEWREQAGTVELATVEVEARIAKVHDGFDAGVYSAADVKERVAAYTEKLERLAADRAKLEEAIATGEQREATVAGIERYLSDLGDPDGMTFEERREVVQALCVEVVLDPAEKREKRRTGSIRWFGAVLAGSGPDKWLK